MGIPAVGTASAPQSRPVDMGEWQTSSVLPLAPNYRFWLVHYRNARTSWEIQSEGLDGPTWLPVVQPFTIRPGVAGVRTLSPGESPEAALVVAKEGIAKRGGIVLDWMKPVPANALPTGAGEGGYLRATPARGGDYFHTPWDQPRAPIAGALPEPKHDRATYNRWRLWLVESGQIPAPDPQVLEDVAATAERRLHSTVASTTTASAREADHRIGKARKRIEETAAARKPWEQATPVPGGGKPKEARA